MDRTLRAGAANVLAGVGRHWGWCSPSASSPCWPASSPWPGLAGPHHRGPSRAVRRPAGVAGIFRFVAALATDDETGATRVLLALLGCSRSPSGCTPCGTFW
jgi:hypothetical protein